MIYLLKKTKKPKGLYLQIYMSEYDPIKKNNRNTVYKTLGYYDSLITDEIKDPISYYKEVVQKMNEEQKLLKNNGSKQINSYPSIKFGYFPLLQILKNFKVEEEIKLFQQKKSMNFDLYKMLTFLIPSVFLKDEENLSPYFESTFLKNLSFPFTNNQIEEASSLLGKEYNYFTSLMYNSIKSCYTKNSHKTNHFYYTSTLFCNDISSSLYISRLGLLFNNDMILIDMKISDESISDDTLINEMKEELKLTGNVTKVLISELNTKDTLYNIISSSDDYIASLNIENLTDKEIEEIDNEIEVYEDKDLQKRGWKLFKNDFEITHRYKAMYKNDKEKCILIHSIPFAIEDIHEKIKYQEYCGYRYVITSNLSLSDKKLFNLYNLLSYITSSFSEFNSNLSINNYYEGKKDCIYGHLLIKFLSCQLLTILKYYVLNEKYTTEELIDFIKDSEIVKINITKYLIVKSDFALKNDLAQSFEVPINGNELSKKQLATLDLL